MDDSVGEERARVKDLRRAEPWRRRGSNRNDREGFVRDGERSPQLCRTRRLRKRSLLGLAFDDWPDSGRADGRYQSATDGVSH